MATTPVPVPTSTAVSNWIALVKAHERLIFVIVGAVLLFHFYGAGLNAWIGHDKAEIAVAQQQAQTDAIAAAATAKQNKQLSQQSAVLLAQVRASNAALAASVSQRAKQTKTQQTVDQTLPLPALGTRWATLVNIAPTEITPTAIGNLTVSDLASRATVQQLETIPQLQADVSSQKQIAANNQSVVNQQNLQLAGLNTQLLQNAQVCTDDKAGLNKQISALKVEKRRAWLHGFEIGAVTGFIGGLFVGHGI